MHHVPFLAGLALAFPIAFAPSSQTSDTAPAAVTRQADAVVVPASPNTTCPIMGKPISMRLHTDTQYGRIYICCKACVKDIQADVEHAYRTSYPTTEKLENKVCPVTDKAITKDAVRVELQGRDFLVADKAAAAIAVESAQVTLAKLADPKLVDVGNGACPVTGEAAAKNVIAILDGRIVRFSSPKAIEEARKDPKKTLAKALELRAREDRERESATDAGKKEAEKKDPGSKPTGG